MDKMFVYEKKMLESIPGVVKGLKSLSTEEKRSLLDKKEIENIDENFKRKLSEEGKILVPANLHEEIKKLITVNRSDTYTSELIAKNINAVVKINEIEAHKKSENSVLTLKSIENSTFKDLIKLQKEIILLSEIEQLKEVKRLFNLEISEKEKNKNLFGNPKEKERIKSLKGQVKEIDISIQIRSTAIGVKEITNNHLKGSRSSMDSTKEVSELVKKAIQTVSQSLEPSKDRQPVFTQTRNVQMER